MAIKSYTWLLLLLCSYSYGQVQQYNYMRELKGVSEQWHKVILPNDIFGKVSQDLSDIRIFGVTAHNDTIESPYLLRLSTEEVSNNQVAFKRLNAAHNERGYYFTFEIPTAEAINQIKLGFKQLNFDWRLKLEGSQNQQDWFTVIDDYRILSIKNENTDFQFTTLTFASSKYRFFRMCIDSKVKPDLTVASIAQYHVLNGAYRNYPIQKTVINENKQLKRTEIDIELPWPVPLSKINIGVTDTFDYYRPLTIQYLSDSLKTEQGWKYNYRTLTAGTLSSIEENEFKFASTTVQKLKIRIHNHNNQALSIDSIMISGYVHELVTRFTVPANYFLCYGSNKAEKPHYDIAQFVDKIPKTMTAIQMGEEQVIERASVLAREPLFKNKIWLWLIMTILILLLGWFSLKMMSKK